MQCRHHFKHRHRPVGKFIPIKDRVSIEQRPPEADGTRFGDWEMDTIIARIKKKLSVRFGYYPKRIYLCKCKRKEMPI